MNKFRKSACYNQRQNNKKENKQYTNMHLTVKPLLAKKTYRKFDIFELLLDALQKNHEKLCTGDVIVISSKFVSVAQGRLIDVRNVKTSKYGKVISSKFQMRSEIAEIILRESDEILGGVVGFAIAATDGIMAPNAGIDKSNAKKDMLILYPNEPYLVAEQLCRRIFLKFQIRVGAIIVDSRLMPTRVGTSGIAIASAGIEPVLDMRASMDLDGNPLKVTFQAVADNIATIANHKMGEGAETRPFAIVSCSGVKLTHRRINPNETIVSSEQCVYVRGLRDTQYDI